MMRQRPSSLTLMAILSALAGLLMFAAGLVFVNDTPGLIYKDGSAVSVGICYLIAAGSNWVIAVGLWRLWTPIRSFAIGYAVVSLVVVIPLILLDQPNAALIAQGSVQIVMLLIFSDFGVRGAFDPLPLSAATSEPPDNSG